MSEKDDDIGTDIGILDEAWNIENESLGSCSEDDSVVWGKDPVVWGKYPAGNILLGFTILMSGSSISKVLLLFRHLGLKIYCARTFFIIRES